MSNKYYLYGKEKIPLVPYESAWVVSPTKVAKEGKALNRHQVDQANNDMIVAANKEVAEQLENLKIDKSFPKRFLVVRGEPQKMKELTRKLKQKKALHFHLRPCYRTRDGHEVFLTDDVLVRLKPGVKPKELLNALFDHLQWNKKNYRLLREEKGQETEGPLVLFRVLETEPDAPLTAANLLGDEKFKKQVVHASPNFLFQARSARLPRPPWQGIYDPRQAYFYKKEWHLEKVAALNAWTAIVKHFPQDPSRWLGSADIRVVVIDNGVDKDHPDLKDNLIWPDRSDTSVWNFEDHNSNPSCDNVYHGPGSFYMTPAAHGTACAGPVAARGHLSGIAPGCKIVPLRCSNGGITPDDLVNAFKKGKELGGHIISYSNMLPVSIPELDTTIQDIITQDTPMGRAMPVFCCAGNNGGQVEYPARIGATIAVGASSSADKRAQFSAWGNALDFLAPGGDWLIQGYQCTWTDTLLTTDISYEFGYNKDPVVTQPGGIPLSNYIWACGTSFATPLAAGVAALMLTVNKNLSPEEIREILCRTADKIDLATANYQPKNAQGQSYPYGDFSKRFGYGRINAAAAVKEAINRRSSVP